MNAPSPRGRLTDWLALGSALALLAMVLTVGACGGSDLVFPGNIPSTSTPAPTATSTP